MKKLFYCLILLLASNIINAQCKIGPELQDFLNKKSGESVSVNIIFKTQLDIQELRDRADHSSDKTIKRERVIEELKLFSEETQKNVLSIIRNEESKGEVRNIISHWLSNSITCETTEDVIRLISQCDEILIIDKNSDREALLETTVAADESTNEITDNIVKINAPEVWEQGYTGKGVLVAILDTGVNYEHPDLADHLWDGGSEYPNHGYNSYDGSKLTMDKRGHGTHCAGTICGDGSNGKQSGVAPDVTLMCIKTLNDEGSTNANAICSGMEFAVEHGAQVLSMSLGIAMSSEADRTMIRQTCVNALEAGVIASVAVGNEGNSQNVNKIPNNVRVPGSCPPPWIHQDQQENAGETSCVVAVGASNKNDAVASISSRGPVTWQNTSFADYPYDPGIGLIRPDVCAPGTDVVSLDFSSLGYTKMSGTSMAAPCVAGVISLMLSKDPTLTPAEISMILETSAVKITDKKNNNTGSGRVDALAAINAIDMGPLHYTAFSLNDENENNKINPDEEIGINIEFENTSSETYNNITAKLICENEWVNITKAESSIPSIAGNGTISIEDAFTIKIDEDALGKTKLYFDVEFYDKTDNRISKTRFIETIYGNTIKYSSITIENDDNGNGILAPAETADLRVFVNNEGNEIALGLTGILSSKNNAITINNAEAEFGSIAPNGSASAVFNVTVGEDGVTNIPLSLEIKDKFNRTKVFDINYEMNCEIIYVLKDEFGDGWSGAKIIAHYSDSSADDTYTITNGYTETFTKKIASGVEVSLEWKNGSLDTECSYIISYDNGTEIFNGKGRQQGTFISWIYDCSCQSMIQNNCEPVKNFSINVNSHSIELKWDAPDTEGVVYYEIYRGTELLATTENLSYVENDLESGTYHYNIRPVYENCYGTTIGKEIAYTVNIDENNDIEANIYPNPSNDKFIIRCEKMTNITIYDIIGGTVLEQEIDNDIFEINDINSGIYFVNIKSENGTIVKKIVKY